MIRDIVPKTEQSKLAEWLASAVPRYGEADGGAEHVLHDIADLLALAKREGTEAAARATEEDFLEFFAEQEGDG